MRSTLIVLAFGAFTGFVSACRTIAPGPFKTDFGFKDGVGLRRVATRFLVFFIILLGGCEATKQGRTWQKIPHDKSELTIVSDVFDVSQVMKRVGLESTWEIALLKLNGKKAGYVGRQQPTASDYCGFAQENIWSFFDSAGVKKYRENAGVANTDEVELQFLKNQHGELYYQDLNGTKERCLVVAELGLGGDTGVCTGTYFIYGKICQNASAPDVEKLDKRVFQMMNDLSFIGGKKELIRK
jgi:hypothetical protein